MVAVDRDGRSRGVNLDVEQLFEGRGRLHGEGGAISDFAADEIRQSAVGEGDVRTAFDEGDVGAFIETACAGGRGGSGGNATDDDEAERR